MTTQTEALKLALDRAAPTSKGYVIVPDDAFQVIKEALAQPAVAGQHKQEPVALETVYETIIYWDEGGGKRSRRELARRIDALYTTPQQRTWVGLTDEEIRDAIKHSEKVTTEHAGWVAEQRLIWGRSIEAKLKEKNNA